MARNGTDSWTLNKGIVKRLAAFERKIRRRMFEGIKVNENWRKRYDEELMQLRGFRYTFICQNKSVELDLS